MKQSAEVVPIHEFLDKEYPTPKSMGSGGGFDHFPGMKQGTVFAIIPNGDKGSLVYDYVLLSKQGVTVLLGDIDTQKQERHIGQRFWALNTLVQILHIPEEKEQENGTSA